MQSAMTKIDNASEQLIVDLKEATLEEKVQLLWLLRRLWNRRSVRGDASLSVVQALTLCNEILKYSKPGGALEKFTAEVMDDIVKYGHKSAKSSKKPAK